MYIYSGWRDHGCASVHMEFRGDLQGLVFSFYYVIPED